MDGCPVRAPIPRHGCLPVAGQRIRRCSPALNLATIEWKLEAGEDRKGLLEPDDRGRGVAFDHQTLRERVAGSGVCLVVGLRSDRRERGRSRAKHFDVSRLGGETRDPPQVRNRVVAFLISPFPTPNDPDAALARLIKPASRRREARQVSL